MLLTQSRTAHLRRPGIYFAEKNQPTRLDLPALDVAAFVGFAQRGPMDRPIAVENMDGFQAIFGGEVALARTPSGEVQYGCLYSAVADFFANGGRRCYVVRVAGEAAAAVKFCLPGIIQIDNRPSSFSTLWSPAAPSVSASSAGRWARSLQVTTRLQIVPLAAADIDIVVQDEAITLHRSARRSGPSIEHGELLRMGSNDDLLQWLAVVAIPENDPAETGSPTQVGHLRHAWRLLTRADEIRDLLGQSSPVDPGDDEQIADVLTIHTLSCSGDLSTSLAGTLQQSRDNEDSTGEELSLVIPWTASDGDPSHAGLSVGDRLQLTLGGLESPADGLTVLTAIKTIDQLTVTDSPPGSPSLTLIVGLSELLIPMSLASLAEQISTGDLSLARVERLRCSLLLQDGEEQRTVIDNLGFDPEHPRFWGDQLLMESSPLYRQPSSLAQLHAAGNGENPASAAAERYRALLLPVRNPRLEESAVGETETFTVALAGRLAPVDPVANTYLPLGMALIFETDGLTGPMADALGDDGLTTYHAGLFLDAQLVPDPGAQARTGGALGQQADELYSIQLRRLRGIHSLYPIEEVALISIPDAIHVGWQPSEWLEPDPEEEREEPAPPDRSRFQVCDSALDAAVDSEEGASPSWADSTARPEMLPVLSVPASSTGGENFDTTFGELLNLHHGLINLAQARRDWVAILTLPAFFEADHCAEWTVALRERVGLPPRDGAYSGHAGLADLSYAAVYHPWLYRADRNGTVRPVPPDGAVCGVIAARALARGAWIAPANVPLQNVLGLQPRLSDGDWDRLLGLGINLIRAEPIDFRMMSAHTLSDEREWLQLSVRRLLILLRRVALEQGMVYVFENNGEQLRNAVELFFGQVLERLFAQGAFRGARAEEAFRVTADDSLNSANDRDNGRFYVDIQVAPSQPLEFITVRLLRTIDGQIQITEVGSGR